MIQITFRLARDQVILEGLGRFTLVCGPLLGHGARP
jgi:hypothetical protein